MKLKLILTILAIAAFTAFGYIKQTAAPLVLGGAAISQLQPSDASYLTSKVTFDAFSGTNAIALGVLVLFLAVIWIRPSKASTTASAVLLLALCSAVPARAYYDVKDAVEYVEIGMNQSAFLVAEQGDNKTKQSQFMSQDYLASNKVASKRIQIPHVLLPIPGLLSRDMYIPAARLVLVDRTPYTREWTKEAARGTSAKDEGFYFESQEGVNINTAVVIGATVKEEDAAKFLYNFGSKAVEGNPSDPAINYASVVRGRSLADVMDSNVRGVVQATLSREFKKRSFYEAVSQATEIKESVHKDVDAYCTAHGITLEYIGYDGGLNFADKMQEGIDEYVISTVKAKAAIALAPTIPVKKGLAEADVSQATADAIRKWNGQLPSLPSFLVASDSLVKWLTGLTGGSNLTYAPAPAK